MQTQFKNSYIQINLQEYVGIEPLSILIDEIAKKVTANPLKLDDLLKPGVQDRLIIELHVGILFLEHMRDNIIACMKNKENLSEWGFGKSNFSEIIFNIYGLQRANTIISETGIVIADEKTLLEIRQRYQANQAARKEMQNR